MQYGNFKWINWEGRRDGVPVDAWELNLRNNSDKSLRADGTPPLDYNKISMGLPTTFLGGLASTRLGVGYAVFPEAKLTYYAMVDVANGADDEIVRLVDIRARKLGTQDLVAATRAALAYYNGPYQAAKQKLLGLIDKFKDLSNKRASDSAKALADYNAAQAAGKEQREKLEKIAIAKFSEDMAEEQAKKKLSKPKPPLKSNRKPLPKPNGRR